MIYLVTYNWYEDHKPTLVEGPEVDDWQAYCNSFLEEATERAIKIEEVEMSWVGWPEIVEQVIEILKEKGYKVVKPTEATYWGASIIHYKDEEAHYHNNGVELSEAAENKVIAHNEKVSDDLDKRRKKLSES